MRLLTLPVHRVIEKGLENQGCKSKSKVKQRKFINLSILAQCSAEMGAWKGR